MMSMMMMMMMIVRSVIEFDDKLENGGDPGVIGGGEFGKIADVPKSEYVRGGEALVDVDCEENREARQGTTGQLGVGEPNSKQKNSLLANAIVQLYTRRVIMLKYC